MNCEACGHPIEDHAEDGACQDCNFIINGPGPCYPWEFR